MYDFDANAVMNGVLLAVLGTAALLFAVTLTAAWRGTRGRAMSYLYMLAALFGTFAAVVVVLGFRGATSDDRPWHVFLDMKYQAKYTSQGQSKYFADGRSGRLPPPDTVPFDGTDYTADAGRHTAPNPDFLKADRRYYLGVADPDAVAKGDDGIEHPAKPKWEGGKLAGEGYWVNRLPPAAVERAGGWDALLTRGRVQFDRNCAVCHGACGRGGAGEVAYGVVGAYGLSVAPANVLTPDIQAQPDGQLYNTVSNGVRQMSGYGHQIPDPLDRWAIVAYVRELQFAYTGPAANPGGKRTAKQ
jgi:mono/diheme cytochrome c family protein